MTLSLSPGGWLHGRRFRDDRAALWLSVVVELKHLIDQHTEHIGNTNCHVDLRRMLAILDRVHRLATYADQLSELLLRHFITLEPEPPDSV